ncbi:MAG: hypothetical protein J7L44_03615 [Candidatus Diapherotrites archaeon]|nr:hypothetical protein [Candidatus Diapherotrites archaeon]
MFVLDMLTDIQTVLGLIYLVWIYAWFKKQLGSAKIAAILAVLVVYLTFFQYPILIWIPVLLFLIATFFSGMFEKIPAGQKKPEHLKD